MRKKFRYRNNAFCEVMQLSNWEIFSAYFVYRCNRYLGSRWVLYKAVCVLQFVINALN